MNYCPRYGNNSLQAELKGLIIKRKALIMHGVKKMFHNFSKLNNLK
jgi:hypothetical protein